MEPAITSIDVSSPRVGEHVELVIEDLAFGGEGVGRLGELVVFVPFVIPGERIEAKITQRKRNFARGVVAEILQASPDRIQPPCRYFAECGGCQYQHLPYPQQLRWKQKQIRDLFERIGGIPGETVAEVIPCPQPYYYRNRILVRSQWNRPAGTLNLGFVRWDGGLVCDIEECILAEPGLNIAITAWRKNPPPKGGIKTVLRIAPEGWTVPEHSFFQNNSLLLPTLIETVRQRIRDSNASHLIDAYCGVGFFSLELANVVKEFVGIELDAAAVSAARANARMRGVTNGRFLSGDTDALLPGVLSEWDPASTAVLLDPPRTGCRPVSLDALAAVAPAQIIYVSCHPATLARDLKQLCQDGRYQVRQVIPLDLFPQTQHVECVADVRASSI